MVDKQLKINKLEANLQVKTTEAKQLTWLAGTFLTTTIMAIAALVCVMCSCEFETDPNLVVINAYTDGYLVVTNMRSREKIVDEPMMFNTEKNFFLEPGTYQVRLIVDQGVDPLKQDRIMILNVTDIYSHNKIVFK